MRRVLIAFPKAGLHLYSQALKIGLQNHIGLVRSPTDRTIRPDNETLALIRASKGDLSGHFTHSREIAEELYATFDYLIYVTRDLRDVVCSLVDHVARSATTGFNKDNVISDAKDKIAISIPMVASWARMFDGWKNEDLFHLTYEEYILDQEGTLKKIYDAIPGCGKLEGMAKRSRIKTVFFNVGTVGRWREYFTDEHKRLAEMYLEPLMEAEK